MTDFFKRLGEKFGRGFRIEWLVRSMLGALGDFYKTLERMMETIETINQKLDVQAQALAVVRENQVQQGQIAVSLGEGLTEIKQLLDTLRANGAASQEQLDALGGKIDESIVNASAIATKSGEVTSQLADLDARDEELKNASSGEETPAPVEGGEVTGDGESTGGDGA